MTEVKLGKYKHFKGNFYEVIGVATHSETGEELIVYRALYDVPGHGMNSLWVRPKDMFIEMVEVDGEKVSRFKFIGDD